MTLPGASFMAAVDSTRIQMASAAGRRIVDTRRTRC
jgi:dihydroxyacid dehydratase/phosphogluconate dehydratase